MKKSFKRKRDNTTLLPKELQERISENSQDQQFSNSTLGIGKKNHRDKKKTPVPSRKELRKQSRLSKKAKKQEHYKKSSKSIAEPSKQEIPSKKLKIEPVKKTPNPTSNQNKKSSADSISSTANKKKSTLKNVSFKITEEQEVDPEDIFLEQLEKKLGINKSGELNKFIEQDELGSLLKGINVGSSKLNKPSIDDKSPSEIFPSGKKLTPLERKIAQIKNIPTENLNANEDVTNDSEMSPSDIDFYASSDFEKMDNLEDSEEDSDLDPHNPLLDDDAEFSSDDEISNSELIENEHQNNENKNSKIPSSSTENLNDKDGVPVPHTQSPTNPPTTPGKYIPPRLRNLMLNADTEKTLRIRKLVQGQLNRLSESNVERIIIEIQKIYSSNPRHGVTEAVSDILISSISSKIHMLDTFLYVNAAFIGALSRIIGTEVIAFIVQELVEKIDKDLNSIINTPIDVINAPPNDSQLESSESSIPGKECLNLVSFLSEIYNFNVISCRLIYDLLDFAASHPNEVTVEIILSVIKTAGYQLRKDEPLKLKSLCVLVAKNFKTLNNGATKSTARCDFMLEQLGNLRNNRMKQVMLSSADCVIPLKKFLQNLDKKRHGVSPEPINVGLEDIRQIETRGKWWLVGSYWAGTDNRSKSKDGISETMTKSGDDATSKENDENYQKLLQLAKAFRMNTEIRKSIFISIMSSQEEVYNHYYTLIASKLCLINHSFKVTLQYSLWDFLRSIGEVSVGGLGRIGTTGGSSSGDGIADENLFSEIGAEGSADGNKGVIRRISNTARMYSYLVFNRSLDLVIFKRSLTPNGRLFFQLFFNSLFKSLYEASISKSGKKSTIKNPIFDKSGRDVNPDTNGNADRGFMDKEKIDEILNGAIKIPLLSTGLAFVLVHFVRKNIYVNDPKLKKVVKEYTDYCKEIFMEDNS
ncbi:Suppressor of glycerol defect protein 1 [Smittium mucronatum]|uniref:Suppressor of glycerol defect protein 1 n=1 Tax=Smittium mucronatum TaxID=133383 RepID=A0A1R0H403_9FUNG|nr:Suppressor of glycerol defect protein 1 [Smittium mucronatum]